MRDTHGERSAPGRIAGLSPILHCVTMTGLVYLRSSFGLTLFRPRIIFVALSIAVALLDDIPRESSDAWREYRALIIFGNGAVVLYWLHFAITFFRELYRKSGHDDYSGTSHGFRLLRSLGISTPTAEMNLHLWIEPAAVILFAAALRYVFNEQHLSTWLMIVAPCMFLKESLNYWAEIRRLKILDEVNDKAKEQGNQLGGGKTTPEAPDATRTGEQTMKRTVVLSEEEQKAIRFAAVLGITEPYDLEEAEANYLERIQTTHPDTHGNLPESQRHSTDLGEALEFFRQKLAG